MLANPRVDVEGQVRPGHRPVRVVDRRQPDLEVQPARPDQLAQALGGGLSPAPLDPSDRGLRCPDTVGQLDLGQPGSPPGLFDQHSPAHGWRV